MAEYMAVARTNYFRVADLDSFTRDLNAHGVSTGGWNEGGVLTVDTDPSNTPGGAIALFCYGAWPTLGEEGLVELDEDTSCPEYAPAASGGTPVCNRCCQPLHAHLSGGTLHESLPELVSAHLVDGDVAVFMEVGFEKMRYLGGLAYAINSAGDHRTVDLEGIYAAAKDLGNVTTATY